MARRIRFAPVLGVLGLVAFLSGGSASAQTEPGLVAAWGLDEGRGTIAGDRSGNGRAGTIAGAGWTTEGRFGSGLVFNGTTSYVRGPSVALGPAFTLMAWVLNPTRTAYETVIMVGRNRVFYLRSGRPTFSTGNADLAFGSAIADGMWHHVAIVSDGATLRAYLDGAAWGTPRTIALGTMTGTLQVGAGNRGSRNVNYFAGTIDEVRVYNRALAQGEVQAAMNLPVSGPPTVLTLTAPANGATVLGATVAATYSVSGDLSQYDHVHLYLDNDSVRMDLDHDGVYQFANVPVGPHTLRGVPARANHSEFGTAATVSFSTAVDPADPTPPTVALVSPLADATLSGVVTLQAEASDDVAVAGVQFFVDGVAVGSADTAAPWTAPWNTASASDGPHTITVRARDTAANERTSAAVNVAVANAPSNPAVVGQWGPVLPWPTAAPPVHTLLQRNAQVLMFDEHTGGAGARLWNPATGAFTSVPTNSNLFCAGHTVLADGRSIVIGGHADAYRGIPDTNLFDPITRAWSRAADMNFARWYPTATTLPDGRVLATSGFLRPGQAADTPEIYDPNANRWTALTAATRFNPMYSFMFVLPDGTVFNAGPDVQTRRLDVATQTWTDVGGSFITGHSAVMYEPGRVMKSGTFAAVDNPGPSVDGRTVVIDMNHADPAWREVAAMAFPRSYHNLVLLPDGTVLVVGGGRTQDGYTVSQAVYEAELWDPAKETWRTMARMQRPRLHHSTALLLADGRVLSAGGEIFAGSYREPNGQIYSPPYLFRGPRPTITAVPPRVEYGAQFFVETVNALDIAQVSLIRLGAVTHGFNQNQRYLRLAFTQGGGGLNVQAPQDAMTAPPGDYMLFIVNANGVPSLASGVWLAP